jgi:UDPglucose--hexose-1-phosphate uridylyltransferase
MKCRGIEWMVTNDMSELRKDLITNNWVIIASERALRPGQFLASSPPHEDETVNPFAVGQEALTPPEIMRVPDPTSPENWRVRVIPNKYPALMIEGNDACTRTGIYERMDGVGAHEVIIESPDPNFELEALPLQHLSQVLSTYRERMRDLACDSRFIFSLLFRNSGPSAGATVRHGHAQLIALPVVPRHVQDRLDGAKRYFDKQGRNAFSDIVAHETELNERLICSNESFACVTPYASRMPYELMIIPKVQNARFEAMKDAHLDDLSAILSETLQRLKRCLGEVDYNFMIQSAPRPLNDAPWYRWHIQIVPKLTQVAGFEWGTGFFINPVAPETAAKTLKRVRLT